MQTLWSASLWSSTLIGVRVTAASLRRGGRTRPRLLRAEARPRGTPRRSGFRSCARPSARFGTSDITPARSMGCSVRRCGWRWRSIQLAEKRPVTGQLDAETMERLDVYKRLFSPDRAR